MGRKLDLSGLTDNEAEHVLEVVKRDMKLRKKEEERLSELRQELDEEGSRCLLLSRQSRFNQRCCIRCCSPFTFLLNPKRTCSDCHYNVCKACRVYNKQDRAWLCSACQKSRLLKTQSLEWFYNNVKRRFKRFGSAKVLKTLYRKHLLEHSTLTELTEGSTYEESVCNEGSVCGSDSAFYRQTEEHSMAETLTVALRVAEEAIDEAITKAEFENTCQETQNEAHYLRQHRAELIEELAKTIVQKIISRRKTLAEMRAEYERDWHDPDLHHHHQQQQHHRHEDQASSSLKRQPSLWRSHSAFSLLDNNPPGLIQDSPLALKKEGSGSTLSTWKSVDRLDNAGVSSVLKSPDGNWIALQSAQLSRPSLLAKRKSLVYSALERESAVVSAYEDMGSDNETRPESDSSWGAGLQEIQRKMTDSNLNQQDSHGWTASSGSRHDPIRDSEGNWESSKPLLALLKRSMSAEIRLTSSCSRSSTADVNCNVEGAEEEEEKRSPKESPPAVLDCGENGTQLSSDAVTPDTLTSGATTPDLFDLESDITAHRANQMGQELRGKMQRLTGHDSSSTEEEEVDGARDSGSDAQLAPKRRAGEGRDEEDERSLRMEIDLEEGRAEDEEEDADDEEMRDRLCRLVAQARLSYFASTDDELDKVGQSEGEREDDEDRMEEEERKQQDEKMVNLPYKICQLEKEVGASRFSSTEDELDRVGVEDEETRTGEDEEEGIKEELAVKVCRLANQVNATQFSSTEDELDRAGRGDEEEEVMDEEALWKLQAEKAIQAAQLRDLSCLVSASHFSSTENQPDGEDEREDDAGLEGGVWERTESFEDLDVKMFDLRDEIEESPKESGEEKVSGKVLNSQTKHVHRTGAREKIEEKKVTEEPGEERLEVGRLYQEKVLREAEEAKETETVRVIHGTEVLQEGEEPEARQEEMCEGRQSVDITPGDSDDEDEEFNRIISSMLMMTLEDMQGGIFDKDAAEKARKTEGAGMDGQMGGGSGSDGQNTSEETGSAPESESRVKAMMPASAAEGRGADEEAEQAGGNDGRERESDDAEDRNTREEEEKDGDPQQERHLAQEEDAPVTTGERDLKAERRPGRVEVEQGEGRGDKAPAEWQTADRREDVAEGGGQGEEAGEGVESAESPEESWTSNQEGRLSPEETLISSETELYKTLELIFTLLQQRHSAVSLRSITTEVLKVLNATEELLQGVEGGPALCAASLPPNTDPKKLDQQFCRLEENVYVAAGAVYSLEAELNDLEECARGISSATSDMELSFLEEQVATAAGKVKQSELQISDISARIAALKSAGLDVDTQSRVNRTRTVPVMPVTLDASRQLRRRLPAPPVKGEKEN